MAVILQCETCGEDFEAEPTPGKEAPSTCLECNPRRKYPHYRTIEESRASLRRWRARKKSDGTVRIR